MSRKKKLQTLLELYTAKEETENEKEVVQEMSDNIDNITKKI